jgi:hypothetical protein
LCWWGLRSGSTSAEGSIGAADVCHVRWESETGMRRYLPAGRSRPE